MVETLPFLSSVKWLLIKLTSGASPLHLPLGGMSTNKRRGKDADDGQEIPGITDHNVSLLKINK